jgi:hypothetical protein
MLLALARSKAALASCGSANDISQHRCRFPPAPARRRDPTTVQGGGDLAERLGAGGLSLGDDRRDGGGERVGPGNIPQMSRPVPVRKSDQIATIVS